MRVFSSNLESNVVNSIMDASNVNFGSITTDIIFDMDDITELEQLLSDLGTSLTNMDTGPLNAERMTEAFIV